MSSSNFTESPRVELISPEGAELRELKARRIVRNHSLATGAVGLIPLPLLDLMLMSAIQANMLKQLGELYGHPFADKQRINSILGGIVGGAALPPLLFPFFLSLIKIIPGLGTAAGIIAMPLTATPVSYAFGMTFIQHFESGGTLLTFNPKRMRQVLRAYYDEGKKSASLEAGDTPRSEAVGP